VAAREPVLVVGCGPVGMTTALCLARVGVPSVVLEAADGLSGAGSKSICVQRDVLEIFERVGLGRAMAARGVSWTLGRTYFRGTELFQIRFPPVATAAFPPFVNLGQAEVESFLLRAVEASELVEVRWGHRVEEVEQDEDGVTLTVAGPRGRERLAAPYAVACDGPRSTVRKALGVEFPGHSFPDRFLIADVRAKLPFPSERRFFFDPPFNPGRQVLVHPQPDDVWRIDWQIAGEVDLDGELASGRLDGRIRAVIGELPYELVWASVYRFHQRAAGRFAAGRVFLAGDAAHLMSPFGARGLNSGVADAENVAWKLALVLAGQAPAALLATYDDERRAAALHNLAVTGETMRFMVPANRLARLARNAVLRGSLRSAALRRRVNSGRLSEPYTYTASPIVLPAPWRDGAGPRVGAVAPDAPCHPAWGSGGLESEAGSREIGGHAEPSGSPPVNQGSGGLEERKGATRLRELLDGGFLGLYLPAGLDDARQAAERVAAAPPPRPPARLQVVWPTGSDPPAGLPAGVGALFDAEGALAAAYGASPGTLWLLRPDGHLAARSGDAGAFGDLVERAAGWRLPAPLLTRGYRFAT
jgi:2-polyprenyl-6-methoxyphenol hydroxylase-like FAD-dependent oxidoreductase